MVLFNLGRVENRSALTLALSRRRERGRAAKIWGRGPLKFLVASHVL